MCRFSTIQADHGSGEKGAFFPLPQCSAAPGLDASEVFALTNDAVRTLNEMNGGGDVFPRSGGPATVAQHASVSQWVDKCRRFHESPAEGASDRDAFDSICGGGRLSRRGVFVRAIGLDPH